MISLIVEIFDWCFFRLVPLLRVFLPRFLIRDILTAPEWQVSADTSQKLPSICTRSLRNDLGRCHETGSFYWPRRTIRIIYRKRSGSDLRKYGLLIAQKMIFLMRFHSFFQEIIVKSIEIDVNEAKISISWLRIGNPDLPVLYLSKIWFFKGSPAISFLNWCRREPDPT